MFQYDNFVVVNMLDMLYTYTSLMYLTCSSMLLSFWSKATFLCNLPCILTNTFKGGGGARLTGHIQIEGNEEQLRATINEIEQR